MAATLITSEVPIANARWFTLIEEIGTESAAAGHGPVESGLGVVEPAVESSKWDGWTFWGRPAPEAQAVDPPWQQSGHMRRNQGPAMQPCSRHFIHWVLLTDRQEPLPTLV